MTWRLSGCSLQVEKINKDVMKFQSSKYPRQSHFDLLESEIERIFYSEICKVISDEIKFEPQFEINTICGKFRIDFYFELNGKRIGIECDGKEFHKGSRDSFRDSILLGDNHIDEIFRFKGKDIYYHAHKSIYMIFFLHPEFLSERGKKNLTNRLGFENRKLIEESFEEIVVEYVTVPILFDGNQENQLELKWKRRDEKLFWEKTYEYIKKKGGGSLDKLIEESTNT